MKRAMFLGGVIAALILVRPASADIILNFTTGDAGTSGGIVISDATHASGHDIAIDTLTVSGDGGYDGVYDVIGTATGSLETGVGKLTFDEGASTITILGGVTCAGLSGPTTACSATDITNSKILVALGTTLLQGTGAFSNVSNTGTASVSFSAPDTKDPGLLTALGITSNVWNLATFSSAPGSGNEFLVADTTVTNTQTTPSTDTSAVPEPSSVILMSTILLGVGFVVRKRFARGNA